MVTTPTANQMRKARGRAPIPTERRMIGGLQDCPRCRREFLQTDPATGKRSCLYAIDCGYYDRGHFDLSIVTRLGLVRARLNNVGHAIRKSVRGILIDLYWRLD